MTQKEAWEIFKNTGSVEAYITFSQAKNCVENNADESKDKRDNIENSRYAR